MDFDMTIFLKYDDLIFNALPHFIEIIPFQEKRNTLHEKLHNREVDATTSFEEIKAVVAFYYFYLLKMHCTYENFLLQYVNYFGFLMCFIPATCQGS